MGGSESKEEVFINQAGNIGGVSENQEHGMSFWEVFGVVTGTIVIIGICVLGIFLFNRCLDWKIRRATRREVAKNNAEVV